MNFKITNVGVEQLEHANQFIIRHNDGTTFQSYNSIIATIDKCGILYLTDAWDYSRTTLKHLYIFIEKTRKNDKFETLFNYNNFGRLANKKAYIQKLIDNKTIKIID